MRLRNLGEEIAVLNKEQQDYVLGNRTIVSGDGAGTGPSFVAPLGFAVQANGYFAVGDAGLQRVLLVNPVSGDRTIP